MRNEFINFLINRHKLDKQLAEFFWLYFMQYGVVKDICGEMKITDERYKELFNAIKHQEKFGKFSVLDFYYNLYGRWKGAVACEVEIENENAFAEFVIKSKLQCCYCGVLEEYLDKHFRDLIKERRNKGLTLEIEHIVNNNETDVDNIVLACRICNNAKSDFLTA
ncbi:MAG: hypothetical protein FWC85_00290, partial [Elusimicrobia bacterium]|nr:hypothetical protein [Elusimicrobiota bacterium]